MQRVLAVLDDKLPMRKSLRRWRTGRGLRTEDYQRGQPSLKIEFAALRDRVGSISTAR